MILCIDNGNSTMKAVAYALDGTTDGVIYKKLTINKLKGLIKELNIEQIALVDSGDKSGAIEDICAEMKVPLFRVGLTIRFPFEINYPEGQVGMDRLCAVMGSIEKYPAQNILCLTLGTCITYNSIVYDAESCGSAFIGGAISPGKSMRAKAMHQFTSSLPLINLEDNLEIKFPAQGTQENIKSGVLLGIKYEIEGLYKHFSTQYNQIKLVYSGGYAHQIKELTEELNPFVDDLLIFNGLYRFLQFNTR